MAGDAAGLANCRVRHHPRLFRIPAGLHRWRPLLRRLPGRRLPRHPDRPAGAAEGIGLSLCARLRPGRRAARRGDPCERPGGTRLQAAAHADRARHGHARRDPRRDPRCRSRPGDRVDRRRSRRTDARRRTAARRHPALGDPARAQRACCRRRAPILNALARLDPLPSITGPAARRAPPPCPAIARLPGVERPPRSVVRVLGTACGLGDRGLGLGRRTRHRRHQRPRRRRRAATRPSRSAGSRRSCRRRSRSRFDPRDDVAVLRVPGPEPAVAARSRRLGRAGDDGRDPRLSARTGRSTSSPARIGRTQTVLTQNAYGQGPVSRLLTPLRGPGPAG